MKKVYFYLLFSLIAIYASANHITGGEMYYTLTGQNGNMYTYHVVLNLYRDCFSNGAPLDGDVSISIFDNAGFSTVWNNDNIPRTKIVHLNLSSPSPCIQNPPVVCYDVGYYEFDVTLPGIASGYTITFQRCCRIAGINNLINSSSVGATYTAQIPGTSVLPSAPANNSARFIGADTVAVCANNPFVYNFGALDLDKDSLSYYFCTAYSGGNTSTPAPRPPAPPPYSSVPYASPFGSGSPLGPGIKINSRTGLLTGRAPSAGIYVVTVCVDEFRNGVLIATQKKDLQIKVADCSLTTPQLDPVYITCNGYDLTFFNHNASPLINSYYWTFGDGNSSTNATPTNTYADTGTYNVKLVVNKGQQCTDSATALAKVYPGFFPGFTYSGICVNRLTQFTDTSHTVYGFINSWFWNFGDPGSPSNTAIIQNPSHTYAQTGNMNVEFIVTSSKGCIDTILTTVPIIDKPPITLNPKDTLICNGDAVQLNALGSGIFNWLPNTNIINANTASPTVNPKTTTNYIVQLNNNGCVNRDTVKVRVVDFVTLKAMPDTTICGGDPVQLGANSDGLHFTWTPSSGLNDPGIIDPVVIPIATTTYNVLATIGGCSANDQVTVRLVPYPGAFAGPDTTICFQASAQLHASIKGSSFSWSPAATLSDPNSLDPVASPPSTLSYVLTVLDNIGCPKPGRDTIVVNMLPKINAFAGRDTAVVIGQPLQLEASGGVGYLWQPPDGLNNIHINDPVANYDGSFDSIRYKVLIANESGCLDSAYLTVKVFKTDPRIFVPTAFTPNGDGRNDVFRPIAVGVSRIDYFRVFNRWGELVFSTTINGKGWDGSIGGKQQGSGTFVWVVRGIDYLGKIVFAKGTVTLIR
ncbi:MAG: PKD domain-containing protein [Flavisolibacter sp.]